MAATGRDIAHFVVGLSLAGLAPVLVFPQLELLALVSTASDVAAELPLHHLGVVLFLALLGAAWVDTGGVEQNDAEPGQWE